MTVLASIAVSDSFNWAKKFSLADKLDEFLNMPQDEWQRAIDATLVKREGQPENIAQAVLGLIANNFITGTCLTVDGGRTVYAGPERLR